jgi:CysZ protein
MFVKNLLLSIISYFKALKYLPYLWKYLLLSFFLLVIFALPVYMTDRFFEWFLGFLPWSSTQKYEKLLISSMAGLSGFVLLMILSPVFSLISEEVFYKISGKKIRFSIRQLIKDVVRGIKMTLRNLIYEMAIIFFLGLIIYLFPKKESIKSIFLIVNLLVTSYFYGFTLLDYAMENRKMGYKESVEFVRNHSGLAIGLGAIYYAMIRINNWPWFYQKLGDNAIYWTSFGETLIALVGVVAGTWALHELTANEE